jgi:hypothetical protein
MELIVAVAILMTVVSGIALLFAGSTRAVRQSYQAMDAFENARGTLNIIERDLITCFTSRENGQYFHFVGTPIGMTFIGTVKTSTGATELGRVTYVLHEWGVGGPPVGGDTFQSTREILVDEGDPLDPNDDKWDWVDVRVRTRALLRYVEIGTRDLDTYPVEGFERENWLDNPQGELGSPDRNLSNELINAVNRGGVNLYNFQFEDYPDLAPSLGAVAETQSLGQVLIRAKKCELWIRMLAGDPNLPDIWTLLGKDPADYVLAENIAWQVERADTGEVVEDMSMSGPWFLYMRTALGDDGLDSDFRPSFNLDQNWKNPDHTAPDPLLLLDQGDVAGFWAAETETDLVGDPLRPRLPEMVKVDFRLMYPSAYTGAPDFDRGFQLTIAIPSGLTRGARE